MLRAALVLALVLAPAIAEGDKLESTIQSIKQAVRDGDIAAARAAFVAAEAFSSDADAAGAVADVIAQSIRATYRKHSDMAIAGLQSFARLKAPGSAKDIGYLLHVPKKLPYEQRALYLAAVRAVGDLHEESTLRGLEKLLSHDDTDLAKVVAESVAQYRALEEESRLDLIERVVRVLSAHEKKRDRARKHDDKVHHEAVVGYLNGCLGELSLHKGASKSAEWSAWVEEAKKNLRERALASAN